jgi:transposase
MKLRTFIDTSERGSSCLSLAKNVFAAHGVDQSTKATLIKPRVPRDPLATLMAQLPACLIGMEACSGAHHWARIFQQHDHTVKLMALNLVAPYRMSGKRGKNDAVDAAAICEAVTRTSMRFVSHAPVSTSDIENRGLHEHSRRCIDQ